MTKLVRYHHYRPRIGRNLLEAAADTRIAHLGDGVRVAKAIYYRNAATGLVGKQLGKIAIEAGTVILKIGQHLTTARAIKWAGRIPDKNFGNTQVDLLRSIQHGYLVKQGFHILHSSLHTALVLVNVVVDLKVDLYAIVQAATVFYHLAQLFAQVAFARIRSGAGEVLLLEDFTILIENIGLLSGKLTFGGG